MLIQNTYTVVIYSKMNNIFKVGASRQIDEHMSLDFENIKVLVSALKAYS